MHASHPSARTGGWGQFNGLLFRLICEEWIRSLKSSSSFPVSFLSLRLQHFLSGSGQAHPGNRATAKRTLRKQPMNNGSQTRPKPRMMAATQRRIEHASGGPSRHLATGPLQSSASYSTGAPQLPTSCWYCSVIQPRACSGFCCSIWPVNCAKTCTERLSSMTANCCVAKIVS